MDENFETLTDLYKRIKPALTTKKQEMHRDGYIYIKEEDIWNYLKEYKWVNSKNLNLYEMIDDILNIDTYKLDSYVKEEYRKAKREINLKEE